MRYAYFAVVLLACVTAGCDRSQPAGAGAAQPPEYHSLVGAKNNAALMQVAERCRNEATPETRKSNPWCQAFDKAVACGTYLESVPSAPMPNLACPEK